MRSDDHIGDRRVMHDENTEALHEYLVLCLSEIEQITKNTSVFDLILDAVGKEDPTVVHWLQIPGDQGRWHLYVSDPVAYASQIQSGAHYT